MRFHLRCILALLILLVACASTVGAAQPRVVVVVAGSASVRDFADSGLRDLSALFKHGSAALMNVRVGRPSHDAEPASKSGFEAGCLSLGASAMATGGAEVRRAGDAQSAIDGLCVFDLYGSRTNLKPGSAQVLHAEIALMQRLNQAASYRAKPGALGAALHNAGIKTAVIGDSDIPGEIHREAVAAIMDGNGVVDYGEVEGDKVNQPDPTAPYGIRANHEALLSELDRLPADCRFIVIDSGDTFRADSYAESCSDKQAAVLTKAADTRLSKLVGDVARRLDPSKDLLIVLSPNARSFTEIEGERMAAIIISGPGFGEGMLTSPSTRKPGVVTLGDVAPTVLGFFGVKPGVEMVGRPMRSLGGADASRALLDMNLVVSGEAQRQVVMRWASVTQSVIVVLVLAAVLLTGSLRVKRMAAWLTLSIVAIPLAMLVLPMIYSGGVAATAALIVVITAIILGLCAVVLRSPTRAFVWLCATIVIVMMVDLLRGAPLMSSSVASYNVVEGARYYGIGNELMGTILGAAIAGLGMALSGRGASKRLATLLSIIVFGAVLVFVAAPTLGAKVGGALAMTPAMVVTFLAIRRWRPSFRGVLLVVLATLVVVVGMFAMDAMRGGVAQSHAGRTVGMLTGGDASGIIDIFQRKLALNFMLVVTSVWSRLLGLCLAGSAVLFCWGRRAGKVLSTYESAAVLGCSVGTAGAFIFNDSGVVAAGTCVVFLWAVLVLRLLAKE